MANIRMTKKDLSKLAVTLLNEPKIVSHIEKIGERVVSEVKSSDNAKKFEWESKSFKDGDRTSVRVGSNTNGSARYEFFSGKLFNAVNKQRN